MIPSRIISISDKVMVEWPPEPEPMQHEPSKHFLRRLREWNMTRTIAEVENVEKNKYGWVYYIIARDPNYGVKTKYYDTEPLSLNQTVFIEPTTEGKAKIVKI